MPGFKVHITASTALGIGYGAGAVIGYDVPLPAALLAGGLCSVSGMLPDLDSGPGVPLRESVAFTAAVVPMLMIEHLKQWGLAPESMVLAGAGMYLFIRFGIGRILKKSCVHRGMFHSIPAWIAVGELAYFICGHENPWMRAMNAGAVMLGFGSHLVLDEIWSVQLRHGPHLKSSFGTAIKFYGDCWWSNLATYGLMVGLAVLILGDPTSGNQLLQGRHGDMLATQSSADSDDSAIAKQPSDGNLQ